MVGDIIRVEGDDYEVVWDGTGDLLPPRASKVHDTWEPPSRTYNKTGKHTKPDHGVVIIDNPDQSLLPSAPEGVMDHA